MSGAWGHGRQPGSGVGRNLELVLADLMLGPDGTLDSRIDHLGAFGAGRCQGGMGAWVQGSPQEAWCYRSCRGPRASSCWVEPEAWIHTDICWEPPAAMRADSGVQVEWASVFSLSFHRESRKELDMTERLHFVSIGMVLSLHGAAQAWGRGYRSNMNLSF